MTSRANPYVGPRSFTQGEALFGRERELTELVDLLIAERIVLLYSPSGAGKTSLVQAGLIPAMAGEGFDVMPTMRVGLPAPANRYLQSCALSLDEKHPPQRRLIAELAGRPAETNGSEHASEFLFVDQFEEILTVDPLDRDAKGEFFARIGSVLRDSNRWALFSMREDYVAALHPYLRPVPTRLANTYRLELLSPDAALNAIQGPASGAGMPFANDAARKLADDLRRVHVQLADGSTSEQLGDSVEPVQLQVVCRRIWERLSEEAREIGINEVGAAGDVDNALASYYADSVSSIAAAIAFPERAIRDWFEQRLITPQGIRGQVLHGPEQSDGLPNNVVWRLIDTHLVRSTKRLGATWFELAHDRLIGPIRKDNAAWRDAHLHPLQKQAVLWDAAGRPAGLLLRDEELQEARRWEAGAGYETPVEHAFTAASEELHRTRRRERRMRWLARGLAALVLVAAALGAYAAFQRVSNASRQLAAQSEALVLSDPQAALDLARQAFAKRATLEAKQALQLAVQIRLGPRFQGHTDVVNGISFSPAGDLLASASNDGSAKLWTVQTGEEAQKGAWAPKLPDKAMRAVFSSDGLSVAVPTIDGSIQIVDVYSSANATVLTKAKDAVNDIAFGPGGKLLAFACQDGSAGILRAENLTLSTPGGPLTAVAFSPDGKELVAGSADGTVIAWRLPTTTPAWSVQAHTGKVNAAAFHPEGKMFATAGDDGVILLWDAATLSRIAPLFHGYRGVSGIAFSRDGVALASAGLLDGTVKLWDVKSRSETLQLLGVTKERTQEQPRAVAFAPPGHDRLAVAADNSIRWYDLDFARLDAHARALLAGH